MVIEYILDKKEDSTKIGFELGSDYVGNKHYNLYWLIKEKGWTELYLEIKDSLTKETNHVLLDTVPLKTPYNIVQVIELLTETINEKYDKKYIEPLLGIESRAWFDGFNHLEEVLLDMGVDKDLLHTALLRVVNEGRKSFNDGNGGR